MAIVIWIAWSGVTTDAQQARARQHCTWTYLNEARLSIPVNGETDWPPANLKAFIGNPAAANAVAEGHAKAQGHWKKLTADGWHMVTVFPMQNEVFALF